MAFLGLRFFFSGKVWILALWAFSFSLRADELARVLDQKGQWQLIIRVKAPPLSNNTNKLATGAGGIPLNQVFALEVEQMPIQSQQKNLEKMELLSFDARMPAHNHGMLVKPVVKSLAANRWEIQGVMLHMRGEWKFYFQTSISNYPRELEVLVHF